MYVYVYNGVYTSLYDVYLYVHHDMCARDVRVYASMCAWEGWLTAGIEDSPNKFCEGVQDRSGRHLYTPSQDLVNHPPIPSANPPRQGANWLAGAS